MPNLFPVIAMLTALGLAGWIIYRFLENFQDSAHGLTIEASMARHERLRKAKMSARLARGKDAFRVAADFGPNEGAPIRFDNPVQHERRGKRIEPLRFRGNAAFSAGSSPAASEAHYPRVVYRCPVMATAAHSGGEQTPASDSIISISPATYAAIKANKAG